MESLKNVSSIDDPRAFGAPLNLGGGMQDQGQAGTCLEKTPGALGQTRPFRIKVTFEYEEEENPESKTIFKNQKVDLDEENNILLAPLIERIKEQGFKIQNHVISYYSFSDKAYIFVAKDPIPKDYIIAMSDLEQNNPTLQIRLRSMGDSPAVIDRAETLKQETDFGIQPALMQHAEQAAFRPQMD